MAEAVRRVHAGQMNEAEQLCREILAIDPRNADAFHLLGGIAHRAGRFESAVELIGRAIRVKSGVAAYHISLGLSLAAQRRLQDAEAQYRKALSLDPDSVFAHNNLGLLLQTEDRLDDAAQCFEHALALNPRFAVAYHNLGVVRRLQGRLAEAFAAYLQHAALRISQVDKRKLSPDPIKLRHDREQLDYLIGTHPENSRFREIEAAAAGDPQRFSELYEQLFHLEHGARVEPTVLNSALDVRAIEADWAAKRPQISVIDDLLSPAALEELRRFCWGATVWRMPYPNGYIGASLADGFACPLLAQIAGELAAKLPHVIGRYPLVQLWAFKYDSELRGIKLHADVAAVNVNFWITADDANRDPGSGGLVVWDVPAPLDWGIEKFQSGDTDEVRAFLAAHDARPTIVPYRCNRAVVFDSDLFHETDRFVFAPGYRNRRINITMLYGLRHQEPAPAQ